MKKLLCLTVVSILLFVVPAHASDNPVKLFGGIGFGTGDIKNIAFSFGGEIGVAEKLSIVAEMSIYTSPADDKALYAVGWELVSVKNDSSLFTGGLFAKYKINNHFFARGGLILASGKDKIKILGVKVASATTTKIGFAGGAGMELPITEKLGAQLGADVMTAGSATWVKFYGNICIKLK